MKADLHFDLSDLDDRSEFDAALQGQGARLVLSELRELLRGWLKHGHPFTTPDQAIEAVRNQLNDLLDATRVDLDSL